MMYENTNDKKIIRLITTTNRQLHRACTRKLSIVFLLTSVFLAEPLMAMEVDVFDLSTRKTLTTKNHGEINFKEIYYDVHDEVTYTQGNKNTCTPNSVAAALSYVHGKAYMQSGFLYERSKLNSALNIGQVPKIAMKIADEVGTYMVSDSEHLHKSNGSGVRYAFMNREKLYQRQDGGDPVEVIKSALFKHEAPVVYTYGNDEKEVLNPFNMHTVAIYKYDDQEEKFSALCSSQGGSISLSYKKVGNTAVCAHIGYGAGIFKQEFTGGDDFMQTVGNTLDMTGEILKRGGLVVAGLEEAMNIPVVRDITTVTMIGCTIF